MQDHAAQARAQPLRPPAASLLGSGGGETGALIRSFDWAGTPLGPVEGWPESLKATVRTLLASRYPMILTWGPSFVQFYNDAYAALIGDKHPAAIGTDIRVTLAEAWTTLGPMIEEVMRTGAANWNPDLPLLIERHGYREEAYFTVSHAPAEDDEGRVAGMLAVCSEVTQQVVGERRLKLLGDLAAQSGLARTLDEAARGIAEAIAAHALDVPYALVYVAEEGGLVLRGAAGLAPGDPGAPERAQAGGAAPWPLGEALAGQTVEVPDAGRAVPITGGLWGDPVGTAMVLPLASGAGAPLGALVVGVSPSRELDQGYRSFLDLLAGQVSVILRNARAAEDERRRLEALAELDRAKTTFFSNASHELRTPLTLILGPLEAVLAAEGLPEAGRRDLEVARRNAQRLLRLVNGILDVSRVEAGRMTLDRRPVDLAVLTADLASSFRSACERAGLALDVACPPLDRPASVDPDLWERIVLNLISNAFKFTHEGVIRVELAQAGDRARLMVRDTGVGIPQAEIPRLFDRFHRVQAARGRSHEGTGIGLALANELVRLHGGSLSVESEPGRGSTFTVEIPLGEAEGPAAPGRHDPSRAEGFADEALRWLPEPGEPPAPQGGEAPRVILADDNADMRAYVTRVLGSSYRVEAVPDGDEALRRAAAAPPDLVIADVMMPGRDGFGLIEALRADPATRAVPVILLSARAGEEARIEGIEAGADDYLVKPFAAGELRARAENALRLARMRAEAASRQSEMQAARDAAEAASALRASEDKLRLAVEATDLGLWDFDIATGALAWSGRMKELYGLAAETEVNFEVFAEGLHPEDREMVLSTYRDALAARGDGRFGFEHRILRRDGAVRWLLGAGQVLFDGQGRPVRAIGTCRDITGRKAAETALKRSEERYRLATEAFQGAAFEYDPDTDRAERSERFYALVGRRPREIPPTRAGWDDLIHPDDLPAFVAARNGVFAGITDQIEVEYRVRHRDGHWVWIWHRALARRRGDGSVGRLFGAILDITERKRAEEMQKLLLDELNHRVKNTLATVQSIAAQTLRHAPSAQAFQAGFEGRLLALSRTHNLLTERQWHGTSLRALLHKELQPYGAPETGRYRLEGEDAILGPRAAVTLGMAFHELATNAAKYGALSDPGGRVEVTWRIHTSDGGETRLNLRWTEAGGPDVAPPTRRGFGSRLIERGVSAELAGFVGLDFAPKGLTCHIDVPLPGGAPQRSQTTDPA